MPVEKEQTMTAEQHIQTDAVIEGEMMTLAEINRLGELEQVVETGLTVFVKVGNALLEIRDSRLYRQQFPTFEAYCRERWGLSRPRAYQLLEAAAVVGNLNCLPMVDTISERQARPLTRLEPEVQREVWKEVLAETPHEEITAKVVEEKAKAADPLNEAVKQVKKELQPEPTPPAQQPIIPEPAKPKDPVMVAATEKVKAGKATVVEAAKEITQAKAAPVSTADPRQLGYIGSATPVAERDANDWHTPAKYIAAVKSVMGGIDLDPFSSAQANETVQAARFFTVADDAFTPEVPWRAVRLFMNPPYGRGVIDAAVNRFLSEWFAGSFQEAVALVNNATETQWFQSLMSECSAVCFTDHRIAFVSPDNKQESGNTRGQAFFYFGGRFGPFSDAFHSFGAICTVVR